MSGQQELTGEPAPEPVPREIDDKLRMEPEVIRRRTRVEPMEPGKE